MQAKLRFLSFPSDDVILRPPQSLSKQLRSDLCKAVSVLNFQLVNMLTIWIVCCYCWFLIKLWPGNVWFSSCGVRLHSEDRTSLGNAGFSCRSAPVSCVISSEWLHLPGKPTSFIKCGPESADSQGPFYTFSSFKNLEKGYFHRKVFRVMNGRPTRLPRAQHLWFLLLNESSRFVVRRM